MTTVVVPREEPMTSNRAFHIGWRDGFHDRPYMPPVSGLKPQRRLTLTNAYHDGFTEGVAYHERRNR